MASSNRHWPSMFKSKPCNTTTHHQWHYDINSSLMSTPYTSGSGCEERTPEPKPRWNPRPEQIRILEAIFNSGMVNPPRDEIRKIRAQLQEYGQVGDANVFYWFQNRKSRSKHKQRQLQNSSKSKQIAATAFVTSSSSSSSDKSSPNNSNDKSISVAPTTVIDLSNSPTASVNQPPFFQDSSDFLAEPFFFPTPPPQGFCFPDVVDHSTAVDNCPSFLLGELMLTTHFNSKKDEYEKMKQQQQHNIGLSPIITAPNSTPPQFTVPPSVPIPSFHNQILQDLGPTKSTVFINDVCLEVGSEPFNVREAFGDDVVLIQSSGQPVLTNEWGVTLHPLQHGASYYLLRPSPTVHLV